MGIFSIALFEDLSDNPPLLDGSVLSSAIVPSPLVPTILHWLLNIKHSPARPKLPAQLCEKVIEGDHGDACMVLER